MRGMGGKRFWCTLFLVLAGCGTTEPNLKPPPHPEEAVMPPETDPRFSAPIAYPKEAERDQTIKKPAKDPAGPMGSPSQFGSPGLSGRGY